MPQSETKIHKDNNYWKSIRKYLDDLKEGEDITFDQFFLLNLNITEEN